MGVDSQKLQPEHADNLSRCIDCQTSDSARFKRVNVHSNRQTNRSEAQLVSAARHLLSRPASSWVAGTTLFLDDSTPAAVVHVTRVCRSRCCEGYCHGDNAYRGEEVVKQWIADNLDGGKVVKESLAGSSSWSSAYVYHTESGKKFFVKLSLGRDSSMFEGEALGLQALYGNIHCSMYKR